MPLSNLRVIDVSTGEDRTAEHKVTNVKQAAAYSAIQSGKGKDRQFTFSDMEGITQIVGKIADKHCGHLLYLQCYIAYNTGLIVQPTHDKAPMTRADIQATIGLKRTAFNEFMRDMLSNGIINEVEGYYYVNSAYHFRGKTKNVRVVRTFTAKIRELYTGRNAKKLGFIYKLLPYIHFETNTICSNPYETDVNLIAEFNTQQIAELTGVKEKSVYSYLRSMKLGDEYVFAEITSGTSKYYKINPFIFYRKKGEPDATLREMFKRGFSGKGR